MKEDLEKAVCTECDGYFLRKPTEHWKRLCFACWRLNKLPQQTQQSTQPFDKEMLRRLLQLCHPDRHNNSEASQIATRFLIDLKGKS